jgi:hypothetical protein
MDEYNLVDLVIGGVPVAASVVAIVQALKWSGLLKTETETRIAVLIVAVISAGVWAAITLFPEIGPVAQVLFTAVVGAAISTLAYQGIKFGFEKLNGS